MILARRLAVGATSGAVIGGLMLGIGGRIVMRLLALMLERGPAFSIGGTTEIVAYGAIVGAVAGAMFALGRPLLPARWPVQGLVVAILTYAATIATLPSHIAETARPFADRMPVVLLLFGLCFLAFGLAMARVSSRASSPAQEAAPTAPLE